MTETQPDYLDTNVRCPKCGIVIGQYKSMPMRQTWLKVGGLILSELHGYCGCGAEFHFCYSEKTMERLIGKIKEK